MVKDRKETKEEAHKTHEPPRPSEPVAEYLYLPPSQQSAQGAAAKPGEPMHPNFHEMLPVMRNPEFKRDTE